MNLMNIKEYKKNINVIEDKVKKTTRKLNTFRNFTDNNRDINNIKNNKKINMKKNNNIFLDISLIK